MSLPRLLASAVVAACALAVSAPAAPAALTFQSPLVAARTASALPAVAVDGSGNVIAAYVDGTDLKVASRPAGGAWQEPQTIADVSNSDMAVFAAFDGSGNATVAWAQSSNETAHVATRPAGAPAFAAAQQIATNINPGLGVDFDVARSGAAILAWNRTPDRSLTVARRPLGSVTFEPQEPLGHGYDSARGAVGEDGTMSATSHRQFEPAKVSVRPASATAWEPPVDLGGNVGPLALPNSAVDPAGNVLGIWVDGEGRRFDGSEGTPRVIKARLRPAGASQPFGAAETIQDLPGDAYGTEFFGPPQIAFDGSGAATVLFSQLEGSANGGKPWRLYAATRPAGAAFDAPVGLSGDQDQGRARLAVAPNGTAIAVWRGFDAPSQFQSDFRGREEGPVLASIKTTAGWNERQTLSPTGSYQPAVAIGTGNTGAVGWVRAHDAGCKQLEVAIVAEGPPAALSPPPRSCDPPDVVAPKPTIAGKTKQRVHTTRKAALTIVCDESCSGTAKAAITMKRRGAKKALKPAKLRSLKFTAAAGGKKKLTFKLTSALAKQLAGVLTGGGSATLTVTTTARDAAGNTTPAKKTIRLVR